MCIPRACYTAGYNPRNYATFKRSADWIHSPEEARYRSCPVFIIVITLAFRGAHGRIKGATTTDLRDATRLKSLIFHAVMGPVTDRKIGRRAYLAGIRRLIAPIPRPARGPTNLSRDTQYRAATCGALANSQRQAGTFHRGARGRNIPLSHARWIYARVLT